MHNRRQRKRRPVTKKGSNAAEAATSRRHDLPIYAHQQQILQHIHANTLTLLQGESGCGKSVGVPQMILDDAQACCKYVCILVAEPHSDQTRSIAEYVAKLRGGIAGGEVRYAVNTSSRFQHGHHHTSLTYVTSSLLFEWLLYSKEVWHNMTHLILDEVDTRTIDQDLLFLLVKLIFIDANPSSVCNKKVVVMSGKSGPCPLLEYFSFLIKSEAYKPVLINNISSMQPSEVLYLEDFSKEMPMLSAEATDMINKFQNLPATGRNIPHFVFDLVGEIILSQACSGDIFLVFLPGMPEICQLESTLLAKPSLANFKVGILSPHLRPKELHGVLQCGSMHANIILATKYAERRIFISRINYVIDFGMERLLSFNQRRGMNVLTNAWTSKTSIKLRTGKGSCRTIFRLFTRKTYESLKEDADTEMKLSCLSRPLLKIKALMHRLGSVDSLCQQLLNPPGMDRLMQTIKRLSDAGAVQGESVGNFSLTQLGKLAVTLSVDVNVARLIVLGLLLRCSAECVIIAAGLMSSVDLFKRAHHQSGRKDKLKVQEDELSFFNGKKFYDGDMYSDLMAYCSVYRHWLNAASWETQWIGQTNVNKGGLHFLVGKVEFLAANLAMFMEEEQLVETMVGEYNKILELRKGHIHRSEQSSWIFCDDRYPALLSIVGAFHTNVMVGKVANTLFARAESREITMAGLNPHDTFKLLNIPPKTLDITKSFEEALEVLGPISKVLAFKDSKCALVECCESLEKQHSNANDLPEGVQKAYFLVSRKKEDGLRLAYKKGSEMEVLHMGTISRERQVFWSTYLKGKKHGIKFDKHTNLPQCAFGLHTQEEFVLAVATNFIGADNSKVHVSATTLLPAENYFSLTALLLFRPFQAYLIQMDSSQKHVYSVQYGPLVFHLRPYYVLVEQLHLIEEIRMKLNKRVLESQLYEGYVLEEIVHLLTWVASQKRCEPHLDCVISTWHVYPTFKPVDVKKNDLAWKLNMRGRDQTSHIEMLDKEHIAQDSEESYLLNSLRMIEPDLGKHYLDEWLDGNKDLNPVFFSLLERLMADPELQEQADVVLRCMHKKCDELVPKKKKVQLEAWYHSLCNPVLSDKFSQNTARFTQAQKLFLQRQKHSQESIDKAPPQVDENCLPMVSKIMSLSNAQISNLRQKLKSNANQVKILLPRSQSQTDNIVIFGHPAEVEEAMKWIDHVSKKSKLQKLWHKSINQTHFLPERHLNLISCRQLDPQDNLYGELKYKNFIQFFVQGCGEEEASTVQDMELNLGQILQDIEDCISRADKSFDIELQARLGRVVFSCPQNRKKMLPFNRTQSLDELLFSLTNKIFQKHYFSDSVTKEEYFYIKACLRLFKPVSIHHEKKINLFLKDRTNLEDSACVTKITIQESIDKPGHFELEKLQQKERLAVIDLVRLEMRHVKADIRLSVQGLKDEQVDEHYREFVSNIQWDGAKLKFPKGRFDVGLQRIKQTEHHVYQDFSISLNEIAQVEGNTYVQKYEVEISPVCLGKSQFSVQDSVKNLDTFLSKIIAQAYTISTHLHLNQSSSSSIALAHAIMCLWITGNKEKSDLESLLYHHVTKNSNLKQGFAGAQKKELNDLTQFDIATLVEIFWRIDGLDFDGVNLSESLLSFFFRLLHCMKVVACESSNSRAQEIISRQGFPPRMALAYASLFKCHCLRYYEWTRILTPHLLELMIGKSHFTEEICFRNINLLVTRKPFRPELPLERILLALGRHWADRNPKSFLQMFCLALKKEQNCSANRILIEGFVRKLFIRYPSDAAVFVIGAASCYLSVSIKEEASDDELSISVIRALELIRDLKVIVTEDCRALALNMLLRLEGMNTKIQEIEKKVFEIYEIDEATFRHCHYQRILSKVLPLKAIHLKELERRGLTLEFCQKMGLKSWASGKYVESSSLIPGLNKEGNMLIGSPGIFIPARDPSGQILGAQIRVDKPATGKYKWLSSNKIFKNGRGPSMNGELPLFCCTSTFSHISILGMCEGGLKAHVLSFLGVLPVIGASGAAFPKSTNLLEKYLAIINPDQIIFFPDAGSQCNDQVARVYFQTFRLLREFGYSVLIAWWGQVNKMEHDDIDDLLCNGKGISTIPVVSPTEFWHILHPAVRKKLANEFPEYSGTTRVCEEKIQGAFVDEDKIEISKVSNMPHGGAGNLYDEYLISIPKRIMTSMPPSPNDLVTPGSVADFTLELRMVKMLDDESVNTCVDWMLHEIVKTTACLGLVCHYDVQCNPCILGLSVHQRCVLIQIPSFKGPQAISIKLQSLLLDKDVIKAGVSIDKDALHIYHFLGLITNSCVKLSQNSARIRQKAGLMDMFRAFFEWEWHEKAEVRHGNWRLNSMTIEQVKFAALSAWSCHLILAQKRELLNGQLKSFCLDQVPHQLADYFQRSLRSSDIVNNQSHTLHELAGATVEIQQGFLILNPNNAKSKALSPNSVVEVSFENGKKPEVYATKRVGDKNVLVQEGTDKFGEQQLDVSSISKLVIDNSKCINMQKEKLEDAVYSILCNPEACPSHILMGLGCLDMGAPANTERLIQPPQDLMLNRFQLAALRMMLSNPLCAVIGPPGTGKTRVITGVAKVWQRTTSEGHILLCAAQQNVAVRHMAETMVENKVQGVMLLLSQEYYTDWRQEEYKHIENNIVISGPFAAGGLKAWMNQNKRLAPRILLCTLALIGSNSFYKCVKNCNILYMIIDESSQAAEGALISSLICLPHLQRLSVLGDPCQLPPFSRSAQSVFDLVARNCKVMTLQLQYRMPKSIAEFVSHEFYGGVLSTPLRTRADGFCADFLWIDVYGAAKTAVGSTSLCNEKEAEAIVMFCKMYSKQSVAADASASSSPSLLSPFSSASSSPESSLPSPLSKFSKSLKLVVLTLYEAQRLLIGKMLTENEIEGVPVHNI